VLSVTFGNLWVLLTNAAIRNDTVSGMVAQSGLSEAAFLMFFFAAFALLAALVFAWYAKRYPLADHYRAV
jgi:POT family proton-dependent oligopeptide transporter